jgi:hypothetical protein
MSILTDLFEKKITFAQAAQEAAKWASNLINHDPALSNAASAVLSDVKQAASNAVEMADTALGVAIIPAAKAAEVALDAALASVTKGASVAFNPFVNDGIDRMAAAVKAEADAWALKAKAALAAPAQPNNGG